MFDSFVNMATVGSLWFAAASFFVAIVVLIATIVIFIGQSKHSLEIRRLEAENKRLELDQRSFHNAMECFEIFSGVRGLRPDGSVSSLTQLAAIEALSNYMNFSYVFPFLYTMAEGLNYPSAEVRNVHLSAIERLLKKHRNKIDV